MIALRGSLTQGVMDGKFAMSGEKRSINFLPTGMVHSAKLGELGTDAMDIFCPCVRTTSTDTISKWNSTGK